MRSNDEIVDIIITEKDKQGLSLSELARRVGLAKSALSRYFNKTREFPLNKAKDFADALGIPVEYLLGFETIRTPKNELEMLAMMKKIINGEELDEEEKRIAEQIQHFDEIGQENILIPSKGDYSKDEVIQSAKEVRELLSLMIDDFIDNAPNKEEAIEEARDSLLKIAGELRDNPTPDN